MLIILKRSMLFVGPNGEKKVINPSPELQAVPDWVRKTREYQLALVDGTAREAKAVNADAIKAALDKEAKQREADALAQQEADKETARVKEAADKKKEQKEAQARANAGG